MRVALLNRFTQLGRPTTVPVAAMALLRLGLGSSRSAFDLCNKADLDRHRQCKCHMAQRTQLDASNHPLHEKPVPADWLTA